MKRCSEHHGGVFWYSSPYDAICLSFIQYVTLSLDVQMERFDIMYMIVRIWYIDSSVLCNITGARDVATCSETSKQYDDVTKWKRFPPYWPFVMGIHRTLVWTCCWTNNCRNNAGVLSNWSLAKQTLVGFEPKHNIWIKSSAQYVCCGVVVLTHTP